jgi:hypothetical protein
VKAVFFALALGIAGSAFAVVPKVAMPDCGTAVDYEQFMSCLQSRVNILMEEASKPGSRIDKDIKAMRDLHKLKDQAIPVKDAFSISLLENAEVQGANFSPACFQFQKGNVLENRKLSNNITKQTQELIDFLGFYHAAMYGRPGSLLFQIKQVRVCDIDLSNERRMSFTNGILRFGFDDKKLMSGRELMTKWQSGDPIRLFDKGHFDRLGGILSEDRDFYFFTRREARMMADPNGGVRGIVWDRVVDNLWMFLDPTGRERVVARGYLRGELSELVERMKIKGRNVSHQELYKQLQNIATAGPGFSQKHMEFLKSLEGNATAISRLYESMVENLGDAGNMYKMIENAAMHAPSGPQATGTSVVVDIRDIQGEINIANQHNISVTAMGSSPMVPWNEFFKQAPATCGAPGSKKVTKEETIGPANPSKAREGQVSRTTKVTIEADGCTDITLLASKHGAGYDQEGRLKASTVQVATSDTVKVQTDLLAKIAEIAARVNPTMLKRVTLYKLIDQAMETPAESSAKP